MISTSGRGQFLWDKRCHVFRPGWNSAIELLSCTREPGKPELLQDLDKQDKNLEELRRTCSEGTFHGSPLGLPP